MQKRCPFCLKLLTPRARKCPNCKEPVVFSKATTKKTRLVGQTVKERYFIGSEWKKEPAATVYRGYDEQTEQLVLIRVFERQDWLDDPEKTTLSATEAVERFVHYGKSMTAYNICTAFPRMLDVFVQEETGYMVQEYFEGKSLKDLLADGVRVSAGNALKMAEQLCGALQLLHQSHMIYGALSPDTLYILKDGTVRLYGLGSPFYDFITDFDLRATLLNPSYAAPELFLEGKSRGPHSDVYSVSAILYRLIANAIPAVSFLRTEGAFLKPLRSSDKTVGRGVAVAVMNGLNVPVEHRTKTLSRLRNEWQATKVKRRHTGMLAGGFFLFLWYRAQDVLQSFFSSGGHRIFEAAKRMAKRAKRFFKTRPLWFWPVVVGVLALLLFVFIFGFDSKGKNIFSPNGEKEKDEQSWYYATGENLPKSSSKPSFLEQFGVETSSSRKTESTVSKIKTISCPELTGYYKTYAISVLEEMGLEIGRITEKYSDEYEKGYVIGQGVKAGAKLEPGNPVGLVISKGPSPDSSVALIEMPSIIDKDMIEATQLLRQVGFQNIEYRFELSSKDNGLVIAQNISAQSEINRNTKIILTVVGREIKVPRYVGLTVSQMREVKAGVRLTVLDENGAPLSADIDETAYYVVKQSVEADSIGYMDMAITIFVKQK